jgi:hypothetical protein
MIFVFPFNPFFLVQVLLPKLNDTDTGVASQVLSALGQLSTVGGDDLLPYLPRLLPLIVASLRGPQGQNNSTTIETVSVAAEKSIEKETTSNNALASPSLRPISGTNLFIHFLFNFL